MPFLHVTGSPIPPSGKTLITGTRLVVTYKEPYVDGIYAYPTNHFAELDTVNSRWKPLGGSNGARFYLPGSASGYPRATECILKEVQEFSDSTSRSFVRGPIRILETSAGEWAYGTPEPSTAYIYDPQGGAPSVSTLDANQRVIQPLSASPETLIGWATAEAFEPTNITYDSDEVVTSASVKWPDGSTGTFTTTTKNTTWLAIDAYTISHTLSGQVVTQTAVTRNSTGRITVKPALSVS